ncbi:hypothetical protein G7Y31_00265 [Corynebacterium lizhenjunii]|uniref:Uncharacterized protein n=1 Tax=Corynebacterium lizhenjunii TaxID=2709394 RepID=A0A7T0KF61_9CORY|nr:hypothetical protein G7Y31_00265 [Corynebacterium lizhenjunii]
MFTASFKEIMAMRLEGKSYDAIASALGCSNREIPYRAGSTATALAKASTEPNEFQLNFPSAPDSRPSQPQACGASDEEMRPVRLQQEAQ